jgi:hypothetical protein
LTVHSPFLSVADSARYETKKRRHHKERLTENKTILFLNEMFGRKMEIYQRFKRKYRLHYHGGRVNRRSNHHAQSVKISILHIVTPEKILSRDGVTIDGVWIGN